MAIVLYVFKKKKGKKEVIAYIGAGYQLYVTLGDHEFPLRYEKSRQDVYYLFLLLLLNLSS